MSEEKGLLVLIHVRTYVLPATFFRQADMENQSDGTGIIFFLSLFAPVSLLFHIELRGSSLVIVVPSSLDQDLISSLARAMFVRLPRFPPTFVFTSRSEALYDSCTIHVETAATSTWPQGQSVLSLSKL